MGPGGITAFGAAPAKARAMAAMPPIGMGGLGASPTAAGANTGNATAALFGGAGSRPSFGGNSFLLGHPGGAYAGGRYTDPGVRYRQAMGQGTHALLRVLSAPGGNAPDGQYRRALRQSARDIAAAKADLDAEMSLTFTAYGPLSSRSDPATRAEAARLARKLGFGPLDSGRATSAWPPRARGSGSAARTGDAGGPTSTFGAGYPWRFGIAKNPYLSGRRGDVSSALSGRSTSPTMATYMQALDAAGRAAAARSTGGVGTPAWRFGMAQNPYLSGPLGNPRGALSGESTSPTMATYMQAMDAARFRETGNPLLFGWPDGGVGADSLIGHRGELPPSYPPTPREKPARQADPVEQLLAFPVESRRMAEGDVWGNREFDAWRDNRTRKHAGVDLDAAPGDPVTPAVNGIVTKLDWAYEPKEGQPAYRYVEVTTDQGKVARHLYVKPSVEVGDRVESGKTLIGSAQDLSLRFPGMSNHVHFEMRDSGKVRPPLDAIREGHVHPGYDGYRLLNPTQAFPWRYTRKW